MKDNLLRKALKVMGLPIGKLLHVSGLMRPVAILKVDGGLCSQIKFYMIGEWLRKNRGFNIFYDLKWFEEEGVDIDKKFPRYFQLEHFDRKLNIPKAPDNAKTHLYRLLYKHINDWRQFPDEWQKLKMPIYLDGYYAVDERFYDNIRDFVSPYISPDDIDGWNARMLNFISKADNAVGVHVRRGDLAKYIPAYGMPADTAYFINSINLLQSRYGTDTPFFIFSDEPEWVKTNVLPHLQKTGVYFLCNHNTPETDYLDFYLLTQCRHFITSNGSFGKFAALMSCRRGNVIINASEENEIWLESIPGSEAL